MQANILNVPEGALDVSFVMPLPDCLRNKPAEALRFKKTVQSEYFKTSVACRLFNERYFGIISLEEWINETKGYLWLFAEQQCRGFV